MQAGRPRQIHEGLIYRYRFDQRRQLEHQRAHLAPHAGIFPHIGTHYAGMRAKPPRLEHRHRRSYPVSSSNVAGRKDDAPLSPTHNYGLVGERRIVALLDGCVERIAIDMRDRQSVELCVAQEPR
jgi:hypothetical protein